MLHRVVTMYRCFICDSRRNAFSGVFWTGMICLLLGAQNSHGGMQLLPLGAFGGTNGITPHGRLIQGTNGDFYGVALSGGNVGGTDQGTVFELSRSGKMK